MNGRRDRLRRAAGRVSSGVTTRKHRPDYRIIVYMGLLMMLGLVIMYAIGPQRANVLNSSYGTDYYTDTFFFIKQTVSLLFAIAAFVAMALVPYTLLLKHGRKLLLFGLAACALLAIAAALHLPIAQESLGATRWFNFGPLGVQPAEILKFGLLVFCAGFLGLRQQQGKLHDTHATLIPLGVAVAIAAFFIVVVQKDLGTGMALFSIVLSMLVVSGMKTRYLAMIISGVVVAAVLLTVMAPHRMARVATFLKGDSTSTSDAGSYHIEHAKIAIGTGGLLGVGIGNSVQATGYLPEAINDSVFAIIGETFGFVGLMAVILLFWALLLRLLKIMDHLPDMRLRLLVAGIFGWLGAHVILNIAAMIGIFPLTGITLPLLSFGGTSMAFIAAALGLAFQLSRYTSHGSKVKEGQYESTHRGRGLGRPRHTSHRSRSAA